MGWKLVHHRDLGIIELILRGELTQKDFIDAASARVRAGKETGVNRFIINPLELVATRTQALDVVDIPSQVYERNHANPTSFVALLQAEGEEMRLLTRFYETAALNRGWKIRVFEQREAALTWLNGVQLTLPDQP
ncbi:MAG: hypothetical protein QNJ40_19945 [Xanthomonadales bacterium]|nr:hypothetical protein [Xanthomonadales bacterium]